MSFELILKFFKNALDFCIQKKLVYFCKSNPGRLSLNFCIPNRSDFVWVN